jgi:hypothetical protein
VMPPKKLNRTAKMIMGVFGMTVVRVNVDI